MDRSNPDTESGEMRSTFTSFEYIFKLFNFSCDFKVRSGYRNLRREGRNHTKRAKQREGQNGDERIWMIGKVRECV